MQKQTQKLSRGERPGSFDTINAEWVFPADNPLGIPKLQPINKDSFNPPAWLAPYRTRVQNPAKAAEGGLHFYLDDFRFEAVWSRPVQSLAGLRHFGTLVTPDFSLHRNWPLIAQAWNVYRSRWVGAFWQAQGLKNVVIPSVSWSYPASYAFCFAGIEPGSTVSISTVGLNRFDQKAQELFQSGFEVMLVQLCPSLILCYGQLDTDSKELADKHGIHIITYPTRWQGLIAAGRGPRQLAAVDNNDDSKAILLAAIQGDGS